jgi:hypothetical protein
VWYRHCYKEVVAHEDFLSQEQWDELVDNDSGSLRPWTSLPVSVRALLLRFLCELSVDQKKLRDAFKERAKDLHDWLVGASGVSGVSGVYVCMLLVCLCVCSCTCFFVIVCACIRAFPFVVVPVCGSHVLLSLCTRM